MAKEKTKRLVALVMATMMLMSSAGIGTLAEELSGGDAAQAVVTEATEAPAETEAPAQTAAPEATEAPEETEAPADTEAPAEDTRSALQKLVEDMGGAYVFTLRGNTTVYATEWCSEQKVLGTIADADAMLYATEYKTANEAHPSVRVLFVSGDKTVDGFVRVEDLSDTVMDAAAMAASGKTLDAVLAGVNVKIAPVAFTAAVEAEAPADTPAPETTEMPETTEA
ncbi:MAG: hypothetical protein Q4C54_06165, partial [Clostridia bacterium]|nr:hypothetical protein [Clostridia bacterium]